MLPQLELILLNHYPSPWVFNQGPTYIFLRVAILLRFVQPTTNEVAPSSRTRLTCESGLPAGSCHVLSDVIVVIGYGLAHGDELLHGKVHSLTHTLDGTAGLLRSLRFLLVVHQRGNLSRQNYHAINNRYFLSLSLRGYKVSHENNIIYIHLQV